MSKELKPCAYCGLPLKLINRPWSDGVDLFEVEHANPLEAAKKKCPMEMGGYDSEREAIEFVNTRYKRTCNMLAPNRESMPYPRCSACGAPMLNAPNSFCARCGADVVDGE